MCQILYVPPKGYFPWEHLDVIYENNSDGFGMMWVDDNRVKHIKGVFSYEEIRFMIKDGPKTGVGYHFRYATRGIVDEDNSHPFMISDDIGMMHNGTISKLKTLQTVSDTAQFAKACVALYNEYGSEYIFSNTFLQAAEELVGENNRILFMGINPETGKRRVRFLNQNKWTKMIRGNREVMMSNTYSLISGYRDKQKWSAIEQAKNNSKPTKRKNLSDYLFWSRQNS